MFHIPCSLCPVPLPVFGSLIPNAYSLFLITYSLLPFAFVFATIPSSCCLFSVSWCLIPIPCSIFIFFCCLFSVKCYLLDVACLLIPIPCSLFSILCTLFSYPCSSGIIKSSLCVKELLKSTQLILIMFVLSIIENQCSSNNYFKSGNNTGMETFYSRWMMTLLLPIPFRTLYETNHINPWNISKWDHKLVFVTALMCNKFHTDTLVLISAAR